jgi:hypothetical protein
LTLLGQIRSDLGFKPFGLLGRPVLPQQPPLSLSSPGTIQQISIIPFYLVLVLGMVDETKILSAKCLAPCHAVDDSIQINAWYLGTERQYHHQFLQLPNQLVAHRPYLA